MTSITVIISRFKFPNIIDFGFFSNISPLFTLKSQLQTVQTLTNDFELFLIYYYSKL
jgi:hypothetical protein